MPIHLPTVSRRRFLVGTAASAAGLLSVRNFAHAAEGGDPNRFVLFADTHVAADPDTVARGVNMSRHCRRAVEQVLAMDPLPGGLMINGDAAYLIGHADDYRELDRCLQGLAEADVPVHIALGNHDDRGPFYQVMAGHRPERPPLEGRHVSVVETEHANWFLVDSLDRVNVTPGRLGERQLEWLAAALDEHDDKPALLLGHHNPEWGDPGNGLRDTGPLFEMLNRREHVRAYIFGHTHRWRVDEREGIRLINLPAVAYVFAQQETSGYLDARLDKSGLHMRYCALDPEHPYHGERVTVKF